MTAAQHLTVDVDGLPVFHLDLECGLDTITGWSRGFFGRTLQAPR